ncbi:conserved protein of unknown function [Tepidanaerobacter acetatoxydans Re1]|uniref:Uncharacterized protein n=1 Tax=Tepidanaerobacter acetatoxydans (strain DSM 21804 / JCM 16047 / Re1) TaxID=1209989 RepID=F4LSC6_TEPAE|nr:hypothetical protein [Tepidanaerobacter acetatoxydans]AEE91192.1 hypothetical protein TepRe1_1044 [Tepidanaerobacter acetatoxydans Re1]CCP25863.1 conserved protein of unknown function [Tepidanaerobacter acetatoxydans Re1]
MELFNDLYNFLFLLQQLIDRSETADIDSIVQACKAGYIIGHIKRNYDTQSLTLLPLNRPDLINKLYSESCSTEDVISKNYKLGNNGLVYLVSLGFEKMYNEIKKQRKAI